MRGPTTALSPAMTPRSKGRGGCRVSRVAAVTAALALAGTAASIRAQGDLEPGTPDRRETAAASTARNPPAAASPVSSPGRAAGFAVAGAADRPPAPRAPAVIARDALRRATIRAVRLATGLRLDGRLDEPVYEIIPPIDDFIQQEPDEGAPGTERTEVWILFDDASIYVAGRLWDSAPPSLWVANEMRRDTSQLRENDTLWVAFDTFNDRRNGVAFYTNPLGAIGDFQITNEGNPNGDWNPVWDVRTGRFEGGWTVEMEIPFKSLRYRPEAAPVWGVQMRRLVRRRNERTYLTPVPISIGRRGLFRVSDAAQLVGLELPAAGRALDVKPYAIGGSTTAGSAGGTLDTTGNADGGLDVKYGVTRNLTADLTLNTDFAQVEVDEQQVNLTRFNLFFPEKREFFLEGRGIFDFARGGGPSMRDSALRQIGGGGGGRFGGGNSPTLFYSRRIGLGERGEVVPIRAGGRITGKVGPFDLGALSIQTGDTVDPGGDAAGGAGLGAGAALGAAATNFTVVRLKRDVLRRSSVGALFTNRSVSIGGDGANRVYGADGTFSFYENVSVVGYLAKTETPGFEGRDLSYQGQFTYAGDRYGLSAEHLVVEGNFRPEVGFVRRDNFRRSYASARFSPRPRSIEAVRRFRLEASLDYIEAADTGVVETREAQIGFSTEFESSDRVGVTVVDSYEFLLEPFAAGPGVTLPVGGYSFRDVETSYAIGAQRRLTGILRVRAGQYFNGTIRSVGFSRGRLALTPELAIEPTVSVNWIETPQASFRNDLYLSRITYTFTPRMFFSGLLQYASASRTLSTNLRLRWEYTPGSEFFVVYTEDRDTDPLRPDRYSMLRNRGLAVKVTRLFRF